MNGWDADMVADFNSIVNNLESGLMKFRKELQGELQNMADEDLPNPTCPPTTLDDTLVGKRMAEYQKCIESAVLFSKRTNELKQIITYYSTDLIEKLPGPVWDNVVCPVNFSPQSPGPFSSRIESIQIVDCWKQEISSMK